MDANTEVQEAENCAVVAGMIQGLTFVAVTFAATVTEPLAKIVHCMGHQPGELASYLLTV